MKALARGHTASQRQSLIGPAFLGLSPQPANTVAACPDQWPKLLDGSSRTCPPGLFQLKGRWIPFLMIQNQKWYVPVSGFSRDHSLNMTGLLIYVVQILQCSRTPLCGHGPQGMSWVWGERSWLSRDSELTRCYAIFFFFVRMENRGEKKKRTKLLIIKSGKPTKIERLRVKSHMPVTQFQQLSTHSQSTPTPTPLASDDLEANSRCESGIRIWRCTGDKILRLFSLPS